MDDKDKKLFLVVFYIGLVSGILFMNYGFFHQPDFIQELMEKFKNLDKLQFVSKDEFFFYVLMIRCKQLAFFVLSYLFLPRYFVLILIDFYFSFCIGGFFSLETYNQGFQGILYGICYFFPHYICYCALYALACWHAKKGKSYEARLEKKVLALFLILFIIGCFLESYVNSILMIALYGII